ncbi:MAG: hypothetical protein WCI67_12145, partial [Chloroflexales bacterium]
SDLLAAEMCGFFRSTPSFYEYQEYFDKRSGQFLRITVDERGLLPWVDDISITPQAPRCGGPILDFETRERR